MIKTHIGCGKRDFGPEWINIDGADFPHIHYKDVTKLPFKNNEVDLIYACHLISYFDREEIVTVLNEWKRVLKSGGILRLATPDFDITTRLYQSAEVNINQVLGPLYGRMPCNDKVIYHRTCYDFASLSELLIEVGFKNVKRYDWRDTEHAQFDDHSQAYIPHMEKENGVLISLNIECKK